MRWSRGSCAPLFRLSAQVRTLFVTFFSILWRNIAVHFFNLILSIFKLYIHSVQSQVKAQLIVKKYIRRSLKKNLNNAIFSHTPPPLPPPPPNCICRRFQWSEPSRQEVFNNLVAFSQPVCINGGSIESTNGGPGGLYCSCKSLLPSLHPKTDCVSSQKFDMCSHWISTSKYLVNTTMELYSNQASSPRKQ